MELWQLLLIIGSVWAALMAFIWNALHLRNHKNNRLAPKQTKTTEKTAAAADDDIEHIFNDEFREELRNRGRQYFEKIIGENAMFLQQDLRLTGSQLNDYMKQEIGRTLKEEFAKYEQSITDAKQIAIQSIDKTRTAIEQQREVLGAELKKEQESEKQRIIERFEKNMAEIINHYVLAAVGNQIDLNDQLEYIIGELEQNKQAIVEDIQNGA